KGSGSVTVHPLRDSGYGITGSGGTMVVAGQVVQMTGTGGIPLCPSYTGSSSPASIPASGGTATVTVTAPPGCGWSASTVDPFVTVSGGSGAGSATLTFAANSGPKRTGTLIYDGSLLASIPQDAAPGA